MAIHQVWRRRRAAYICALTLVFLPCAAPGQTRSSLSDLRESLRVTEDLQGDLQTLREEVRSARATASSTSFPALLAVADRVRADLLLTSSGSERLLDALRSASLPAVVMQRQQQASAALAGQSTRLLARLDALTAAASAPIDAARLRGALDSLAAQLDQGSSIDADRVPLGVTLPVRSLTLPAVQPQLGAAIVPAYANGVVPAPAIADLGASAEAAGDASGDQARTLHQSAIEIYEFVRNSISTEFYYGAMKGADATLRDRGGNDTDQASLLIAMMRQSGIPARYVRGVISLNAQQAFAWTGLSSTRRVTELLTRAGIPFRAITQGGAISRFEVEHTWAEVYVPYANYRGVLLDVSGRAWIPLDPSFKTVAVTEGANIPAVAGLKADAIASSYLSALQSLSPLDFFRRAVTDALMPAGLTLAQVLRLRSVEPVTTGFLPSTLPYATASVNQEFAEVPDALRHRIRFVASASGGTSFDITLPAADVLGHRLTLSYIPATVEDQIAADAFLGLDNTPAYLVQVRPVLKVGGVVRAAGAVPQQMGALHEFRMDVLSPRQTTTITNSVVAGGYFAIAFAGGSLRYVPADRPAADDTERPGADLLFRQASDFLTQWRDAEDRFAELLHVVPVHPVPAEVMVGNAYHRTVVFGQPQSIDWRGVQVDADLNVVEPIPVGTDDAIRIEFTRFVGLSGSMLEGDVLQRNLGVDSVSAARLLQLAHAAGVPVEEIDSSNLSVKLPLLDIPAAVRGDVTDAVNQRWRVTIPRRDITHNIWTGTGYIATDPATGAAGYFISGGLAGGMTSEDPDDWVQQQYVAQFGHPYQDQPNTDASMAATIRTVAVTDQQTGTVGQALTKPLAVAVRDKNGRPVQGASVTFVSADGGGLFGETDRTTAVTDYLGVARAPFTLGKSTLARPFYVKLGPTDQNVTQVGQNIVTAFVADRPEVALLAPFQLFGYPDAPHHLAKTLGDNTEGVPGTAGGSLVARVEDQYGNPIANAVVRFRVIDPLPSVSGAVNLKIFPHDPPCAVLNPVSGDCDEAAELTATSSTAGAAVDTIFGNTRGTTFRVVADITSLAAVAPQTFSLKTTGTYTTDYQMPELRMVRLELVSEKGQPVNAAAPGSALPRSLEVVVFAVEDNFAIDRLVPCDSGQCYHIRSLGTTRTRLVDNERPGSVSYPGWNKLSEMAEPIAVQKVKEVTTVAFAPIAGNGRTSPVANVGPGRYASQLTLGPVPARNVVEVGAEATIWAPCFDTSEKRDTEARSHVVTPRLVKLQAGQHVSPVPTNVNADCLTFVPAPPEGTVVTIQNVVFGVRGTVSDATVHVTDDGYAVGDNSISYSIAPSDYIASTADVDLFEAQDRWLGALPGTSPSGEGIARIVAGTFLDPEVPHSAQLILNRGTEVEIQTELAAVRATGTGTISLQPARVTTRLDRINGDMCTDPARQLAPLAGDAFITPGDGLVFRLSRDAIVTIAIDGNVLISDGVTYQDLPLGGGVHRVAIPAPAVTAPGPHSVVVTGRFRQAGLPDATVSATGVINHELIIEGPLPVGHALIKNVDLKDGHVSLSRQDVSIAGQGPPLQFVRSYSSAGNRDSGVMGAGWTHNYDSKVVHDTCGHITVVGGEGSGIRFFAPTAVTDAQGSIDLVYRAQAGYHGSLVYHNADDSYDFYTKNRAQYHYERATLIDPTQPVVTIEHRLSFIADPHGNRQTLSYEVAPPFNVSKLTDASGRTLTFSYQPFGFVPLGVIPENRLTRIEGPLGLVVSYDYDEYGNLIRATRDVNVESYDYTISDPGDRHNLVKVTGPNHGFTGPDSDVIAYAYYSDADPFPGQAGGGGLGTDLLIFPNKNEFVKTVTEGAGSDAEAVNSFVYDYSQIQTRQVTTVVDARGTSTRYTLEPLYGAVTEKRIVRAAGDNVTTTRWAFQDGVTDVYITRVTDPNGRATSYAYDTAGNLRQETVSTGVAGYAPVTTAQGTPVNSIVTSYDYDPVFNKMTRKVDAEGNVTTYDIDPANGDVRSMTTDPGGGNPIVTRYTYGDAGGLKGLLLTTIDPRGNITKNQDFDAFGNPQTVIDGAGNVRTSVFDQRSRLRQATDTMGHQIVYDYDALDRVLSVVSRAWNQPTDLAMASPDRTSSTTYFPGGQKRTATNGLGHVTTYAYDAQNRVTSERDDVIDADGQSSLLQALTTYDVMGNPTIQIDRDGFEHRTAYDDLNRITEVSIQGRRISSYTYDAPGNRLTETDVHGHVTSFEYDGLYRVVRTHLAIAPYVAASSHDRMGNVISATDANGRTTRRAYDGVYRVTSEQDPLGNVTTYAYDAAGNKTRETSESTGLVTRFEGFDGLNRSTRTVQEFPDPVTGTAVSYTTTTSYIDAEHAIEVVDPLGHRTRQVFNGHDALIQQTVDVGGLNLVSTFQYDGNGNQSASKDAEGSAPDVVSTYDGLNRRIRSSYALGGEDRSYFDGNGNIVKVIDKRGIVTQHQYDAFNRKTSDTLVESISNGGAALVVGKVTYDDASNRAITTDANQHSTTTEYDALHREVRVTDALGQVVSTEWDALNRRAVVDKRGIRTEFEYDALDRLMLTRTISGSASTVSSTQYLDTRMQRVDTDPLGTQTVTQLDAMGRTRQVSKRHPDLMPKYGASEFVVESHTFDGVGNTVTSTDARGNLTTFEYDGANRVVVKREAAGSPDETATVYTYDRAGNVLTVKDGRSHAGRFDVRYTYDARYRKTQEENGAGDVTRYGYDQNGNIETVTEPAGGVHVTTYTYDEVNQLLAVDETRGGAGGVTLYRYDPARNKVAQQDANGNLTTYHYDSLNRLTDSFDHTVGGALTRGLARFAPMGGDEMSARRWHYEYDPNGNQTLVVDAEGQRVAKTYDYLGRLTRKDYTNHASAADGSPIFPRLLSVTSTFDANGNSIRIEETKQFDPGNTVVEPCVMEYDPLNRQTSKINYDGKRLSYGYDRQGNQITVTDADGLVTRYAFDAMNRVASATADPGPAITRYAYFPDSLVRSTTFPNGVIEERTYDATDRLTHIVTHNGDPAAPIDEYEYQYDRNGNRLAQVERHRGLRGGASQRTDYAFDALNRLSEVAYTGGPTVAYTYAQNGNRLSERGTDPQSESGIDRLYAYNRLNQLTSIVDRAAPASSSVFDYDANGNTVSEKVGTLDTGGGMSAPSSVTSFAYDIRDNMVRAAAGGAQMTFDYDYSGRRIKALGPFAHIRYLYDQDAVLQEYDGNTKSTTLKYNYGDSLLSLETVTPTSRNDFYYHLDGLRSTSELTDPRGGVQASYMYDAWGGIRDSFNLTPNRRTFTGQYRDTETGLYYFGARYYDAAIGRFLSQDPSPGTSTNPPSLNRYQYANANPLRYVDPSGYSSQEVHEYQSRGETISYRDENGVPSFTNLGFSDIEPANPCEAVKSGPCNPRTKEVDDYVVEENKKYLARMRAEGEALQASLGRMYKLRAHYWKYLDSVQREEQLRETARREALLAQMEDAKDRGNAAMEMFWVDHFADMLHEAGNDIGGGYATLGDVMATTVYTVGHGIETLTPFVSGADFGAGAGASVGDIQMGHAPTLEHSLMLAGDVLMLLDVNKTVGKELFPTSGLTKAQEAVVMNMAKSKGTTIGFRATDPLSAMASRLWAHASEIIEPMLKDVPVLNKLKLLPKPIGVEPKSVLGIAATWNPFGKEGSLLPRLFRSDADMLIAQKGGKTLNNPQTLHLFEQIEAGFKEEGLASMFGKHGSHLTADEAVSAAKFDKIAHPGSGIFYGPDGIVTRSSAEVRSLAKSLGRWNNAWDNPSWSKVFWRTKASVLIGGAQKLTDDDRQDAK